MIWSRWPCEWPFACDDDGDGSEDEDRNLPWNDDDGDDEEAAAGEEEEEEDEDEDDDEAADAAMCGRGGAYESTCERHCSEYRTLPTGSMVMLPREKRSHGAGTASQPA